LTYVFQTKMSTNVNSITPFIVDAHYYARMQSRDCEGVDDSVRYAEFISWNIQCISELKDGERAFLFDLCQHIKNNKLNLMDLESCLVFEASAIYYDQNKKLCIVNPR